MKRFTIIFLISYGLVYGQTCEGMFNVYDSCYDINNCNDGYFAMLSLTNAVGLKSAKKLASICESSCKNKKSGIKKMTKDEFMSVVCPSEKKEDTKNANPTGNNQ